MFVTTVCLLFLLKLKWPKNKSLYDLVLIVSELVPIRGGKTSSHAYKTGPWYLLEILFTISNEQPRLCYMGVPPGLSAVAIGSEGAPYISPLCRLCVTL